MDYISPADLAEGDEEYEHFWGAADDEAFSEFASTTAPPTDESVRYAPSSASSAEAAPTEVDTEDE